MNACKDRIAETERVKERKRARVERGAGSVSTWERGADGGVEETHEGNIMRDVLVGKRGSETGNKEQSDNLRKTLQFEQDAPNASSSSFTHFSLLR